MEDERKRSYFPPSFAPAARGRPASLPLYASCGFPVGPAEGGRGLRQSGPQEAPLNRSSAASPPPPAAGGRPGRVGGRPRRPPPPGRVAPPWVGSPRSWRARGAGGYPSRGSISRRWRGRAGWSPRRPVTQGNLSRDRRPPRAAPRRGHRAAAPACPRPRRPLRPRSPLSGPAGTGRSGLSWLLGWMPPRTPVASERGPVGAGRTRLHAGEESG